MVFWNFPWSRPSSSHAYKFQPQKFLHSRFSILQQTTVKFLSPKSSTVSVLRNNIWLTLTCGHVITDVWIIEWVKRQNTQWVYFNHLTMNNRKNESEFTFTDSQKTFSEGHQAGQINALMYGADSCPLLFGEFRAGRCKTLSRAFFVTTSDDQLPRDKDSTVMISW